MFIVMIYFYSFRAKYFHKGSDFLNSTELKQDFYKRFGQSDNFLHFTATGLLCTLLGHDEFEHTPSLMCPLSMRVQMFARRFGGGCIDIQDVTKNEALTCRFASPSETLQKCDRRIADIICKFSGYGLTGSQILYERTMPPFLPCEEEFAVCLVRSLLKTSETEADSDKIARLAYTNKNFAKCLALAASRKGYCTLATQGNVSLLPLPLSRHKIISVHCKGKHKSRTMAVDYAFKHLKQTFPHIGSFADITPEMLTAAKSSFKSKAALKYAYHLTNENQRIVTASQALKRCDIRALLHEINASQKSLENYWDLSKEQIYLAHFVQSLHGVRAVRAWRNGVMIIAEDEYTDHIVGMVRDGFESNMGYLPYFCVSEVF